MLLDVVPACPEHRVLSVQLSENTLTWSAEGCTHALVVGGPFGGVLAWDDALRQVLEAHGAALLTHAEKEASASDGRTLALVRRGSIRADSYDLPRRHCRYAVWCCTYDRGSDTLSVHVPQEGMAPFCDVPERVRVSVTPHYEERRTGFLGLQQESVLTAYELSIEPEGTLCASDELGLCYEFEGCPFTYPLTAGLVGKRVYVRPHETSAGKVSEPIVKGGGAGYQIVKA